MQKWEGCDDFSSTGKAGEATQSVNEARGFSPKKEGASITECQIVKL